MRWPGTPGGCRRLADGGRRGVVVLLLTAACSRAAEARLEGFDDEVLLLQRDLHRDSPSKPEALDTTARQEVLRLDMSSLHKPLNMLRGALEGAEPGQHSSHLFELFRQTINLVNIEQGDAFLVTASDTFLSSTEKWLLAVQQGFDGASAKEMSSVMEAANNMQMSFNNYREHLRDREQDFNKEIQHTRPEDVIRVTADFMSKEVRDLRPVIKDTLKEFLRMLRHVNWGPSLHYMKVELFIMEPAIVNGAASVCAPISATLSDWDDLTETGFCRITAPIIKAASNVSRMQNAHLQLQRRREELMSLQAVTQPPTWEEGEAPFLLDVAERLADMVSTFLDMGMDVGHRMNSTVGGVLRQRLRCHELVSSSPSSARVGVAIAVSMLSLLRLAA